MLKQFFSVCATVLFAYPAFSNPICDGQKYYCDCKILQGCGGQCWVPTYIKLDLATGNETIVKYIGDSITDRVTPGSEDNCRTRIDVHPLCR